MAESVNISISRGFLGVLGAIVGGTLGYFAFFLLARQGLYSLVLPGALLGLGCGFLSGTKSNLLGIVCGLSAVLLGLFTEWRFAPFIRDASFTYFMTQAHHLKTVTLIMITAGGLFGFWFGKGRMGGVGPRRHMSGVD